MESFRFFLPVFVFITVLATSNVFCALRSKMNGVQNDASDVTWAHAVNSWDALEKALAGPIDFLEADISLGHVDGHEDIPAIPIMAHPPDLTSDISLITWLSTVLTRGPQKSLKLDFKSLSVLEPSLIILEKYASKLNSTVWLNADVLPGPVNSPTTPVQVDRFLALCHQYFPNATLSTGWTTYWFSTFSEDSWRYGWHHVRKMADVIRCTGYEKNYPKFTFPVRGIFASRSIKQLQWLLSVVPNSTLTVWTGKFDPLELGDLLRIRASFPKHKVYYDVPEKLGVVFKEKKNLVHLPRYNLITDDGQWMTLTRGQGDGCSTLTYVKNSAIVFGRSVPTAVLQKNVILSGKTDLKVTGRIKFFSTESGLASQSGGGVQELKIVLADVSLFTKNMSSASGSELDLTTSDTNVIWSAINSSIIYSFQHNYDQEDKSCQIFKLDTSQDKSFEVWTVPCDTMLDETDFEEISKTGIPAISSRKRLVLPQNPFMIGFVSEGDEHVAIYDLNIKGQKESSTAGASPTVSKTSLELFSTILLLLCLLFY